MSVHIKQTKPLNANELFPNRHTDADGNPIFRTSYLLDSRREYLRHAIPNPRYGFVLEDLDLIVRLYDRTRSSGRLSAYGRYLKVENKWNSDEMGAGQRMTHELEHKILRKGDPEHQYYVGFYLINWPSLPMQDGLPAQIDFDRQPRVNGIDLTWDELISFLKFEKFLPSLFDNGWQL